MINSYVNVYREVHTIFSHTDTTFKASKRLSNWLYDFHIAYILSHTNYSFPWFISCFLFRFYWLEVIGDGAKNVYLSITKWSFIITYIELLWKLCTIIALSTYVITIAKHIHPLYSAHTNRFSGISHLSCWHWFFERILGFCSSTQLDSTRLDSTRWCDCVNLSKSIINTCNNY